MHTPTGCSSVGKRVPDIADLLVRGIGRSLRTFVTYKINERLSKRITRKIVLEQGDQIFKPSNLARPKPGVTFVGSTAACPTK
jgi:hypothetical protein